MSDRKALTKLENSELWQQAQKISKIMYDLSGELPDDERISVGYRLRSSAFNITSDIAELIGSINYRESEYPLGSARKNVFSLKNTYRFLGVQKVLKIDPDVMVLLDDIVAKLDAEIHVTWIQIDDAEKQAASK